MREVKGILALALAGFGLIALYSFEPRLHPLDQSSPVGPVGGWLGAASFWAFGYAGYLFPVLLALYGVSAFVRRRIAAGWPGRGGLGILLVSVDGHPGPPLRHAERIPHPQGRRARLGVSESLRATVGTVGAWIVLLALIPVGILFVTQVSYGGLSRAAGARLARRLAANAKHGRAGLPSRSPVAPPRSKRSRRRRWSSRSRPSPSPAWSRRAWPGRRRSTSARAAPGLPAPGDRAARGARRPRSASGRARSSRPTPRLSRRSSRTSAPTATSSRPARAR